MTTNETAITEPLPHGMLSPEEGRALAVLDRLLGQPVREKSVTAAGFDAPRPELVAVGGQRVRAAALRWLVDGGGYRERLVLRNGRRVRGRAWDRELSEGFRLEFTRATLDFWLAAARHLPGMASAPVLETPRDAAETTRKHRRKLRDMVTTGGTRTGDWVFFLLASEGLRGFKLAREDWQTVLRRIRAASPLATLWWPEGDDSEALRERLQPLTTPVACRLMECAEDRFARRWTGIARGIWESHDPVASRMTRWRELAQTLVTWLDVVDQAQRLDLARPIARAAVAIVTTVLGTDGAALRQKITGMIGLRTIAERDEAMASLATVVTCATRILQQRDAMALERYGDERYDEAQVFVKDVDAIIGPSRREVSTVARALAGEIG